MHDTIDRRDQDLPSPQRQRGMRRLKIGIADGVEDDVGALPRGEFADARGDIRHRGIDDFDMGIGVALIGLALAHHADHARAAPACDLHGGLAYLAIDAHHQHGLVLVGHAGAPETFHRGDEGNPDPGGLLPRQIFRLRYHRIGFNSKMRGMGAVAPDPEIARRAEHLASDPAGWTVDDGTRVIAAGRARKHRVSHQAGRRLDVGRIDGRRPPLDHQFMRGPRQRTPLDRRCERSRVVSLRGEPHAARLDRDRSVSWGGCHQSVPDFECDFERDLTPAGIVDTMAASLHD